MPCTRQGGLDWEGGGGKGGAAAGTGWPGHRGGGRRAAACMSGRRGEAGSWLCSLWIQATGLGRGSRQFKVGWQWAACASG